MDSLEWTCRVLITLAFWIYSWSAGTVLGQRALAKRWLHDAVTSRPEGVQIRFSDTFAAWCTTKGIAVPEPLPLTPYQLYRRPLSRQRQWIVFVPNGALKVIAAGTVEVHVDYLPPRTTLKVEEVGELRPPKKPRGGLKIPALPHFSPAWSTPGFA